MYAEEEADFFALLISATHDLAVRSDEPDDPDENVKTLIKVGHSIGQQAQFMCGETERDMVADCATRLQETAQERGVSYTAGFADRADPDKRDVLVSWRDLQLAEAAHERACNPDPQEIAPREQMLRFTTRLARIAGRISIGNETWRPQTDLLLLGVRLINAAGEELPDRPVPRNADQLDAALGGRSTYYTL